ncbi:MAG: phospholipase D family protein [Acidiferrobacterales bacterium]
MEGLVLKYQCNTTPLIVLSTMLFVGGCASLPTDVQRVPSYVVKNTGKTGIGVEVEPVLKRHPGKSGFYVLNDGMEAFVARMKMADAAEKTLDVQYYIWHFDKTGRLLYDRLIAAADRGVRVRLLLDDLDTAGKDLGLNLLNLHKNIEVRIYNPFANRGSRVFGFMTDLSRVNRRMHNKSMTADNQATIVGGRNIGNEYFGATSASAFADLDVLAIGPIVGKVSEVFDDYWNSEWVYPISAFKSRQPVTQENFSILRKRLTKYVDEARESGYMQAVRESDILTRGRLKENDYFWGRSVLLYDAPSKASGTEVTAATHMGPDLIKIFDHAENELLIVSPYFVPGKEFTKFLGQRVKQGVRVRILTNSLAANDVGVVHAGYMRYRTRLLKYGVELYEYKSIITPGPKKENEKQKKRWSGSDKASLHAKTFSVDQKYIFVGSFNLDPRSYKLNTEMGVLFESVPLAKEFTKQFDQKLLQKAYRLELITTPASKSDLGYEEYYIQWVTIENGKKVTYKTEPEVNWWGRFVVGFLSIFVIESFL